MFKIKADDTFTWPVKAKVPQDGKHKTVQFDATFRVLPQAEINAILEEDGGNSMRVLDIALISFSGIDVEGEDGEAVTDHAERKLVLFRHPYMVAAVSNAYAEGIAGYRTKN